MENSHRLGRYTYLSRMDLILKQKKLAAFLLYLVVIFTVYAQVVFFGKSLVPSLFYPAGGTGNPHFSDSLSTLNRFDVDLGSSAFYEQPVNRFIGDLYLSGKLPLWNPFQGSGAPLAAQYSTRAFFPYQILENLSPYWLWDYFILGRLLIGAFFTYLFLSSLGVSSRASFLGGIFYAFSGSNTWFINNEQFMNVAMILPVVMFSLEKMFSRKNNSSLVFFAAAIAMLLYAGQPEVAIFVLVLAFAYYAFKIFIAGQGRVFFFKEGMRFIVALILGLSLSAAIILPFLEFVSVSFNCHPFWEAVTGSVSPTPSKLWFFLLVPHLSELPTYFRFFPYNGAWDYLGGYTGVSVLYLTLAGWLYDRSSYRKYLIFFAVFGFAIVLKNFGFPLTAWIGKLPLLDQSWSPRWAGPVWTFSLACSGAFGLEIILRSTKRRRLFSWLMALLLGAVVIFIHYKVGKLLSHEFLTNHVRDIFTFFSTRSGELRPVTRSFFPRGDFVYFLSAGATMISCVLFALPLLINRYKDRREFTLGLAIIALFELWFYIPQGKSFLWSGHQIIPFLLGFLSIFLLIYRKIFWFTLSIGLAIVSAVGINAYPPQGLPGRCDPFLKQPYVEFLQKKQDYHRIAGEGSILHPNFASVFGILDIRYINSLSLATYQNYVDRHLLKNPHFVPEYRLWFTGTPDGYAQEPRWLHEEFKDNQLYYSFLGVKYLLVPKYILLDLPLIYDQEIKIYENPACLPRVFVAHTLDYASSYAQAQNMLSQPGFNPQEQIVLEQIPENSCRFMRPGDSRASIKDYQPDKVLIEAFSEYPGFLVLTDTFYPGWKVYVDGRLSRIYRVNGLVRGVYIEQGSHSVIFKYQPVSFKFGLGIAVLAVLFSLGLIIKGRRV